MKRSLLLVNINLDPKTLDGCNEIRQVLLELEPSLEVHIVHWRSLTDALVDQLRPMAVILGPNENPFPSYPPEFDGLLEWVRQRQGPTLGICGGHQVLALANGIEVAPVFDVPPATTSYAGMPKVKGDVTVRLLKMDDPLLEGLPTMMVVAASHVDEAKGVPEGFTLLAEARPSRVQ
ncbi:MAG: hypothetical protein VX938_01380, partial [Myxococcota bacterium]|nr:hypothetical protein [Myxococcota bacterium]